MEVEVLPTDDCWINDSSANRDKNLNRKGLGIGRWEALNRSLLKFNLRDLDIDEGEVAHAELRLYGKALYAPCIAKAIQVGTDWNEESVTWNTQPPIYRSDGRYLIGETTNIPAELDWFSIPIDTFFVRRRWGRNLSLRLQGYEEAEDSYFYASDREEKGGAYAPRLILSTEAPAPPPPPEKPAVDWRMLLLPIGVAAVIAIAKKRWGR